jgi:hypothetical protein
MRHLIKLLIVTLGTFSFFPGKAQNKDEMKAMMDYMTPGDIHKMMAKDSGTWSGAITIWEKPGAQPMTMNGEAKFEMILGGRYLQETSTAQMMGMPFQGIGTFAYDNAKKIFLTSWIDNFGTGMMYLEGTWDQATRSVTFAGKEVDPVSGKDIKVREVMKFVDDNTQVMEMYSTLKGQEFKAMEIKFTRKM